MDKKQIILDIENILTDNLNLKNNIFDINDNIIEKYNLDSIDMNELICDIEYLYNITLPNYNKNDFQSISAITNTILNVKNDNC